MIPITESLAGRLLIAAPAIGDPRFERSVIYLCAHNADHAMGLTINHPVGDLTVPSLLTRLGIKANIDMPKDLVLIGGPVERERGFVLHTTDFSVQPGTLEVSAGISLTATREALQAMANTDLRPRRALLALGYAGWGGGQLEAELQQNAWLIADPLEAIIFGDDHDHKWSQALASIGAPAERLSTFAGRA